MRRMGEKSVAIIPNAPLRRRNEDMNFPHRPDSNFHYLAGEFPEPDAVLVLVSLGANSRDIFFCASGRSAIATWDFGANVGAEGAKAFGFSEVYPLEELDQRVADILTRTHRLYYSYGLYGVEDEWDDRIRSWIHKAQRSTRITLPWPVQHISDLYIPVSEMRLVKEPLELEIMQRAAQISANAHVLAMQACRSGMMEYQLEAILAYHFRMNGGSSVPAYPCIVGGGKNACMLHYHENNDRLLDGDLVLMDAGCEYEGYASDITRTIPVNGKFTPEQKAIYEIVLTAQKAAIQKVCSGKPFNAPHETAVRIVVEGLLGLGIMEGNAEDIIAARLDRNSPDSYYSKQFFPHRTGHLLGRDVHDVGSYFDKDNKPVILRPNIVTTVEPGIYIKPSKDVEKKWWNIGIRIEDDVVVTNGEPLVLSDGAPKEIEEIEAIMRH